MRGTVAIQGQINTNSVVIAQNRDFVAWVCEFKIGACNGELRFDCQAVWCKRMHPPVGFEHQNRLRTRLLALRDPGLLPAAR